MFESLSKRARRIPGATLVAAAVVIGGLILTGMNWGWLIVVGLGTFGPGILRELGILQDQDELQRQAAHRAGYHAFLVTGLLAFGLVAYIRSSTEELRDPQELATLFLAVLWFTWLFSSLFAYWGPRKTAVRILWIFGGCWLLFIALEEHDDLIGFLVHSLIAAPFFLLALLARRWARLAGALLLVAAAFFLFRFGWYRVGPMGLINQVVTMVLFLGPLLGAGIALLGVRPGPAADPAVEA